MFGTYTLHASPYHLFIAVIEDKLGEGVWEMGKYVYCAAEEACPIGV